MVRLSFGQAVLWCYLIWYSVMATTYFDPSPRLWLTSIGLSLVVGCALILSVSSPQTARMNRWQIFRLFFVPFCVSSFAALVKDHGFILIFSPKAVETGLAAALCALFLSLVWIARRIGR